MQACLNSANIIARHDCLAAFTSPDAFTLSYAIGVATIAALAYLASRYI